MCPIRLDHRETDARGSNVPPPVFIFECKRRTGIGKRHCADLEWMTLFAESEMPRPSIAEPNKIGRHSESAPERSRQHRPLCRLMQQNVAELMLCRDL